MTGYALSDYSRGSRKGYGKTKNGPKMRVGARPVHKGLGNSANMHFFALTEYLSRFGMSHVQKQRFQWACSGVSSMEAPTRHARLDANGETIRFSGG
jgi:hypothetical protein